MQKNWRKSYPSPAVPQLLGSPGPICWNCFQKHQKHRKFKTFIRKIFQLADPKKQMFNCKKVVL